jgi:hypothetical protein
MGLAVGAEEEAVELPDAYRRALLLKGAHVIKCPSCGIPVHWAGRLISTHEWINGCKRFLR